MERHVSWVADWHYPKAFIFYRVADRKDDISKTIGKQQEIKLTGDAPANLLTFLTKNRDLLQAPGQDETEPQAEQE